MDDFQQRRFIQYAIIFREFCSIEQRPEDILVLLGEHDRSEDEETEEFIVKIKRFILYVNPILVNSV